MHTHAWAGYFLLIGGVAMLLTGVWYLVEAATFLEGTERTVYHLLRRPAPMSPRRNRRPKK